MFGIGVLEAGCVYNGIVGPEEAKDECYHQGHTQRGGERNDEGILLELQQVSLADASRAWVVQCGIPRY